MDLEQGLEAYERGDYRRAVEILDRAGVAGLVATEGTIRMIYLGNALAWEGKYDEAVRILEGVAFPLLPDEWSEEAQWTLFVAMKRSGRKASADSLLHHLASMEGAVGKRARDHIQQ
jgi:tetratricopeptide (TPR) repeat protein